MSVGKLHTTPIHWLGGMIIRPVEAVGDFVLFAWLTLSWTFTRWPRSSVIWPSLYQVGVLSLPVVVITGAFIGMVLAVQSYDQLRVMHLESQLGAVVNMTLVKELGPVLAATMLAGRVGSAIAAEIGTMRVTEQIDALESMAVNPIQFLVLPRIVAGILMAPILVMLFFLVGMGGAYLVAVINMGVEYGAFFDNLRRLFFPVHIGHGLIKGAMFGGVIVLIGCFQGFNAKGGGRGVGIGTNRAVVYGSVCVLIFDYFITEILFSILPPPLAGG